MWANPVRQRWITGTLLYFAAVLVSSERDKQWGDIRSHIRCEFSSYLVDVESAPGEPTSRLEWRAST